jgi:hypothetical protein
MEKKKQDKNGRKHVQEGNKQKEIKIKNINFSNKF